MCTFDLHLLAQTLVYWTVSLFGLVVCVTLGVSRAIFNGNCLLYAEIDWDLDRERFSPKYSSSSSCDFPIFLSVFGCILYALAVGVYHAYATYKSRQETNIAFQMWVWPFMLVNTIITLLVFISSCMISVGLSTLCPGSSNDKHYTGCADAQDQDLKDPNDDKMNTGYFYNLLEVSQVASWICCCLWFAQMALGIFRIRRNRLRKSNQRDADHDKANITQNGDIQSQSEY